MQIVRATREHANDLTQISILAKRNWEYPESWIQLWIPSLTITAEYIDAHEVWMMVVEDQPVAYYSFNGNEEGFWLDNLWVLPEYMGQGIGKTLFQHALERCKTLGVSILKIEADPNAQSFYERMGAHKVSEHSAEIQGEPRVLPVMEINL
jgi:GNAT superfamily N-acetyltransferase